MYRLLLLLLSSQCVAAHCVTCHATVRCCPSCHPSRRCAVLPLVSPSSGCMLGRGVLPVSLPPPRCLSCRHRVRVRLQCATHVTATAVLPPACWAAVCCPRCHRRRAARCVAIKWLCVGPWCAARVVTAAVLPIVLLSGGCVQQCAAAHITTAAALLFVSLSGDCMSCGSVLLLALLPLQPLRCSSSRCRAIVCCAAVRPVSPPHCLSCRCRVAVCCAAMCCCPHC